MLTLDSFHQVWSKPIITCAFCTNIHFFLPTINVVFCVFQPPPGSSSATPGVRKWVVNDADKARYDEMFEKADTDKDGYVNGAEIKGIFLKSGLQQQVLARIWYRFKNKNK